jgi:hypothetical protein
MLQALLMVFCYDNVVIQGVATTPVEAKITKALVDNDGCPLIDVPLETLCALAADVIAAATIFRAPDVFTSSGAAAEWVGIFTGSQMPRCDTEEILKGVSGAELTRLAVEEGIEAEGSVSAIRKRLVGNLPAWRPDGFNPARGRLHTVILGSGRDDDEDEPENEPAEAAE